MVPIELDVILLGLDQPLVLERFLRRKPLFDEPGRQLPWGPALEPLDPCLEADPIVGIQHPKTLLCSSFQNDVAPKADEAGFDTMALEEILEHRCPLRTVPLAA